MRCNSLLSQSLGDREKRRTAETRAFVDDQKRRILLAIALHQSEVLIIHFTDGSILGIDTGSNIGNLCSEKPGLQPNEFHVDLNLQWVPEKT